MTNKKIIAASGIVLFLTAIYGVSKFFPTIILLSRDTSFLILVLLLVLLLIFAFYRMVRILVKE